MTIVINFVAWTLPPILTRCGVATAMVGGGSWRAGEVPSTSIFSRDSANLEFRVEIQICILGEGEAVLAEIAKPGFLTSIS